MIFKGIDYKDLLLCFDSFGSYQDTHKRVILRHDTDSDSMLKKSLQMARIEADMGIKAYYYVLHGRDYWGNWPLVKKLQDMGHSVGFHNQVISEAIRMFGANAVFSGDANGKIKQMILDLLADMRGGGLLVDDTSGHGHPSCYKYEYRNHSIWKGAKERTGIQQYELSDFGLLYDAMLIKPGKYISDSGNRWCISKSMMTAGLPETTLEVIERVYKDHSIQLNIHPQWWS